MGTEPEIAVIIGAYRREEFLDRAIDSVLHQTLPRAAVEIQVVTDFDASSWRTRYGTEGIEFARDSERSIGRWLLAAARRTRAPLVAFLDDDDEFEPARLAEAVAIFRTHPEIGLYHNRILPIDTEDRPLSEARWGPEDRDPTLERTGAALVPAGSRTGLAPYLTEDGSVAFSASTMIVRRDLLDGPPGDAFGLTNLPDFALVVLAVTHPSALYLDPRRFTRYRRHAANASDRTGQLRIAVDGHATLAAVARARGRDDLADWLERFSVHYDRILRGETVVNGIRGRVPRSRVASEALGYLQFLGRHPAERAARLDVWSAPLYAAGYLALPGLAYRIAAARPTARRN